MSTAAELNASIDEYTIQLQQVEQAIRDAGGPGVDRQALGQLRDDLNELLQLTRETLDDTYQQGAKADSPADVQTALTGVAAPADDPLADEFHQFMREIREVDDANRTESAAEREEPDETGSNSSSSGDHPASSSSLEQIKQKLTALLGTKCSAPHTHAWGGLAYHNAMICGLDDRTEYAAPLVEARVCVKVLFTQPTHREMVPCAYYLDGDCRFDLAGQCRYSHGHLVPYGELRAYREPDYGRLQTRSRCPVLVKRPDRMWHKAHTVAANGRTCRLRLDGDDRAELSDVDYADVLPLHADVLGSDDSDDDSDDSDDDSDAAANGDADDNDDDADGDNREQMHRHALAVEQSLLTAAPDRPLGEWEKYTRGFGSRMMQKYGYVLGTGLGHNGAGIVVPISAQVLPAGRSLDHCMALREQANGDRNLFSVERRLRQRQRQQQQRDAKAEAKRTAAAASGGGDCTDVFSFMNERVFAGLPADGSAGPSSSSSRTPNGPAQNGRAPAPAKRRECYAEHSTKDLNVRGFQLGEEIRRKEAELQQCQQSLVRHATGTPVHGRLQAKLDQQRGDLAALRHSEGIVRREQSARKDKTKLTVF